MSNTDKLKWAVLSIAGVAFLASVGNKIFFHPEADIAEVTNVIMAASALILGASAVATFKGNGKH